MASSSSSIPNTASSSSLIPVSNPPKYDVFLSFRGEETRKNFTCHLNEALIRSGIVTFIDNREVKTGDEISSTLLNAIRSSSLSIIIFSQNYASSSFCLIELLEILKCYETRGQIILPIFYHVSPFDISKPNGTYGEALAKHEERFTKDKVQKWRAALAQVAELGGSELKQQLETEFIEKIVKDVLGKLNRISSADHLDPGLVGIRSRVETVESLLCLDSLDFCMVGIWGMGGIGKTTIARAVYNRIANQFKAFCFLENVTKYAKNGPNDLQKKLLSEILGEGNHILNDFTHRRLGGMKILIVIDDVDDSIHLKDLVRDLSCWFGPGSRIIATSRNRQVLKNVVDKFKLYEVEGLNYVEAPQLFNLNAFKQSYSPEDHLELSSKFVHYAKGNPLALKVMGCSLFEKSMEEWESSLDNLKKSPDSDILDVLRVSYDRLDYPWNEIFLFIACFFKGEERDRVTTILNGCGFSALIVISGLVDKCLLTITDDNRLSMHDLIQEMGHYVVFQESIKEPGKRSRLWDPQDICDLFKRNTGTGAVESISLDLSQISDQLYISHDAFTRMPNLKLLKFYFYRSDDRRNWWGTINWRKERNKVKIICERLESLPDELRYLCWPGYPLKSLPFNPGHLVELEMPNSKLQHLWKNTESLGKLRRIDLHECRELTEVPDLSKATNLESMYLTGCSSLTKFPKISSNVKDLYLEGTAIGKFPSSAIKCLSKIVRLIISRNKRLRNLPNMHHLTYLEFLYLDGCSNITKFPEISGAISYLHLSGTAIEEVPYSAIKSLSKIVELGIRSNTRLRNLPSMRHLTSLELLDLDGCSNITEFPDVSREIQSLILSGTGIEEVPSFVGLLTNLRLLSLERCKRLIKVSSSIFRLKLERLELSGCSKLENFPEVLENEGMLHSSIELLTGIRYLSMGYCKNLESLPNSLCNLTNLSKLDLSGCPGVEKMLENVLLSSPSGFCSLRELDLSECNMVELPSALSRLSSLDDLNLRGNEFESLSLKLFTSLRQLNISYCKRLRSLQDFPLPSCLEVLVARNCTSLETLPDTNGVAANYKCFYYYLNCFKLDERARINIQADARLKTQLKDSAYHWPISIDYPITNELLRVHWEEGWDRVIYPRTHLLEEDGRDSFCFPGIEIPEWLIYQNQGSSIKIDLPPHWYSNKFVGFVVCIIASCESCNHIDLSYVKCKCKIKDPDCDGQDLTFSFPKTVIDHPMSDHVFIKSIMPRKVLVNRKADHDKFIWKEARMTDVESFNTENSFCWEKARFRFSTSKGCCKVKKCGINLVYSEWEDQVLETLMMTPRGRKKKIAALNQKLKLEESEETVIMSPQRKKRKIAT